MQDHNPLATLLEQAEGQRNLALAAFNQARARHDGARTQLHNLEQYRRDYTQRWQQQFHAQGAALAVVRSYHQFAARLELALTQQTHAVSVAEQALSRANDTLAGHELRVASVRKLIERRAGEVRRQSERREQRADDETAQRVMAARRNANPEGVQA